MLMVNNCSGWLTNLVDTSPKQLIHQKDHSFEGKVVVVGAGASGLAAASLLESHGVEYQIIEATDHYGGRVQKDTSLADFPIDIGAEWIHYKKDILNRLIGKKGNDPEIDLIAYRPLDVYSWNGKKLRKSSKAGIKLTYWSFPEYKFKNTTWFDYLDLNFARKVRHNIIYNSEVVKIDYTGEKVVLTTLKGENYDADKVILTVPVGVLRSRAITFNPEMPAEKMKKLDSVPYYPGFKLIMKFNKGFYPDVLECSTERGEQYYYDVAFGKDSKDHILGLLSLGENAEYHYGLGSEQKIIQAVLSQLDEIYDGQATANFSGEYLLKDWGRYNYALGTWTDEISADKETLKWLNRPLDDKVFFAGGTYNKHRNRGTVHGAIMSGYDAVYEILEDHKQLSELTSTPEG